MKKQLLSLAMLALTAFGIQTASAQNYQPFSSNLTYHFSAQDSIYALKIDSSYVQNGDSVFVFNDIAKRVYNYTKPPCAIAYPGGPAANILYGNNEFGEKMIKKPNGEYLFETLQGEQFLLKTKAAIGQSWPVMVGQPITITLTSKSVESVLTTTDSVLTFTTSIGDEIKLSKNYGFLKVPGIASIVDSYFPAKELLFYALPEKQLGKGVNDPFNIFDHQPGDIFGYYLNEDLGNGGPSLCWERWIRDEILSRTLSPDGQILTYQVQREELERGYGMAGAPAPFCSRPSGFTLHPTRVYTLNISKNDSQVNSFLSQYYHFQVTNGQVITGIYKDYAFNNRERIDLASRQYYPCAKTLDLQVDYGARTSYVAGLGFVEKREQIMGTVRHEILQGYRKNGVIFGTLRTMAQIMSTGKAKELAPAIAIFPNPAENAATIKFDQPLTSGKLTVTFVNTLGQTALHREFTEVPDQQVQLNVAGLAKGIYVVQATQNGKTFISRFVKQ